MSEQPPTPTPTPRIKVRDQGPYHVSAGVPLRRKAIVTSTRGESITWEHSTPIDTAPERAYLLCRCGESSTKPFCDASHIDARWNGECSAGATTTFDERAARVEGAGLSVGDDRSLCAQANFCADRASTVWKLLAAEDDATARTRAISMIERCPSGALTYRVTEGVASGGGTDGVDNEPDLPEGVAVVPDGPLWVTGGVRVELADGTTVETRNRVTLCRCGGSRNKPFCDGTHLATGFRD